MARNPAADWWLPVILALWLSAASALLCSARPFSPAQQKTPYTVHVDSSMVKAPIRVQSNLVVVPVFVLNKQKINLVTHEEWDCVHKEDNISLEKLSPLQPFLFSDCYGDDVRGLAPNDFQLFLDGVKQKIDHLTVEYWDNPVRDNRTFHAENSTTPSSIWSSTDLGASRVSPGLWQSYYDLDFAPSSQQTGCHNIKVQVDRPGMLVLARKTYCAGQTVFDPLYGTEYDKRLQSDLASETRAKIPLSIQVGFVYPETNAARVDIRLDFPWNRLSYRWDLSTWWLRARISILGLVYAKDRTIAARFSDLLYPPYWSTYVRGHLSTAPPSLVALHPSINGQVENMFADKDPAWLPARYETQLDLQPGNYDFYIVLSDGEKFGRVKVPLVIDGYDGKTFALSSVMLCKRYRPAQVAAEEYAAANFAPQYVPFVSGGLRFTPTADMFFRKDLPRFTYGDPKGFHIDDPMLAFFEVYEPMTAGQPAGPVMAQAQLLAAKGDTVLKVFPAVHVTEKAQARGSFWAIPVALKIPWEQFSKGAYRLEVHAVDASGKSTSWQTANFTIQ